MSYKPKRQKIAEFIERVLENVPQANRAQVNLQCLRQYGASPEQVEDILEIMVDAGEIEYDNDNIYKLRRGERVQEEE